MEFEVEHPTYTIPVPEPDRSEDELRWPYASWGPIPAIGFSLLALFAGLLLSLPFLAIAGIDSEDDAPTGILIAIQTCTALGFILIVILAPLAEEICFRGFLFGGLRTKLSMIPAALAGGLFFGLLHYSTGWSAVPVLIVLGAMFAVVYEKTGSLWPPIILHTVNNGIALAVLTAS